MVKTSPVTKRQNWERREPGSTFRSLALVVVCLAIFLDALDVSIVTIALPNMSLLSPLPITKRRLPGRAALYARPGRRPPQP